MAAKPRPKSVRAAKSGEVVIAVYRPKPGKAAELEAILKRHVPTLRAAGLVSDRPVTVLKSLVDGTYLELFEWVSAEAAEKAHESPAVMEVWNAMGGIVDFLPLTALSETARPFAHFAPVDGVVS